MMMMMMMNKRPLTPKNEWMNEGIHLGLDTWIVPGQIRKASLCRGLGNRYTPAGTTVLISAVAHYTPPPFQAAQNATTVNTRSSIAPCTAHSLQEHASNRRRTRKTHNLGPQHQTQEGKESLK